MEWEPVIGLEIHVQLKTKSKIFSGSSTAFGAEPNTQASIIDLGFPGVLPVLNQIVVDMAIKFGLAIRAPINQRSVFARKNYFYPDLPKGYQISQFDQPIVKKGALEITLANGQKKIVGITRAHLEEDAGKSLHEDFQGMSGIDLNRAGTPLLEIVSEPEIYTAQEAIAYVKAIHSIVTYLDICDGNMAEGSMRCDANVSVRPKGSKNLGTRTEIKNVNSFRFIEKAIEYEISRQINVIESGDKVIQETRLYDSGKNETRSMRGKEEANDYRYFPDPDLLPVVISDEHIAHVKQSMPELAADKKIRFIQDFGLSDYDASLLTASKALADYFETANANHSAPAKLTANWLSGEVLAALNKYELEISQCPITPIQLSQIIKRVHDKTLSNSAAKKVFNTLWGKVYDDVDTAIEALGLKQVTDSSAIEAFVDNVLESNPDQVQQYKDGKTKIIGYLVGQVMKQSKGKADPGQVNQLIVERLKE